jgi:hypothetical protein
MSVAKNRNSVSQVEATWLQFQLLVVGGLERSLGGWRKQLAAQLLGPLVDWFVAHLVVGAEGELERATAVHSLVPLGHEVVHLLDSSSLRKRLHKVQF